MMSSRWPQIVSKSASWTLSPIVTELAGDRTSSDEHLNSYEFSDKKRGWQVKSPASRVCFTKDESDIISSW